MKPDELMAMLFGEISKKQPQPTAVKMCNFCSRRHAGGRKNCRIYKSIKPGIQGSTCPPKRQKEVRAISVSAQEHAK